MLEALLLFASIVSALFVVGFAYLTSMSWGAPAGQPAI